MFQSQPKGDYFHIVDEERGVELAPVFDYDVSAKEVAEKVNRRYPFFSQIPTVPMGTPYPRPDVLMPGPYPQKVSIV